MASEEGKQEGRGFTVQDRRRFSPETGEAREDAADSPRETVEAVKPSDAQTVPASESHQEEPLPEINFSTFVISLSTQALMHLGEISNPISGKIDSDVPAAKQMIDMLGMIREKTNGNLNANEDRLMQDILFDLRMKYVEAVKKR
ncbi:MAG TPA: DUF1844 domain-containing protein [Candidatus Binatia bacterium]